jgi:transcriptional regulator with XRE-family HTH domain
MNLDQNQISQRIRWIMQNLKINQNQLAQQLQVTQPAVSKYLQGRIPPPSVLLKLAELAGSSIEWLLTGKENVAMGKISEKAGDYYTPSSMSYKFHSLPFDVQIKLNDLVNIFSLYLSGEQSY